MEYGRFQNANFNARLNRDSDLESEYKEHCLGHDWADLLKGRFGSVASN